MTSMFSPAVVRASKSLNALVLAAGLAFPSAAFAAESNRFVFRDSALALDNSNQHPAFIADSLGSKLTQTVVAKALVQNTTTSARTVQCELQNGLSTDFAVATVAAGGWATLTMEIASPASTTTRFSRMDCSIVSGETFGANVQWGKLLIRYGVASLTTAAW